MATKLRPGTKRKERKGAALVNLAEEKRPQRPRFVAKGEARGSPREKKTEITNGSSPLAKNLREEGDR